MSDTVFFGVLCMPYEMAMADELSRKQFYACARDAVCRLHAAVERAETAEARVNHVEQLWRQLDTQLRYERENPSFTGRCSTWQMACGIARRKEQEALARVKELEAELMRARASACPELPPAFIVTPASPSTGQAIDIAPITEQMAMAYLDEQVYGVGFIANGMRVPPALLYKPSTAPISHEGPPADLIRGAYAVHRWFQQRNIDAWACGPIMSRFQSGKDLFPTPPAQSRAPIL